MSDGTPVVSITIWDKTPTFHAWGDWEGDNIVMICGRKIAHDSWRLTRMRRDHAEKIGQPCVLCFRKGMPWSLNRLTTGQAWRYA